MPTYRRRRWQGRCFGHQQGLRHCIGSLNIPHHPSSCMPQSTCPPHMYDDYPSPCASDNGPRRRDRSTSCRVDRSTSYRKPSSFRYERHPRCKRRPSHPSSSKHRYRTCLPTEPLYCDEYGQPCSSRRDCQEQTDRFQVFFREYSAPPQCFPNQEPPSQCYPQEAPYYVPKSTSQCYSPPQPCNVMPQPGPCYPQQPQPQQQLPCFPPETMPPCYIQQPIPQCIPQEPPCFSEDAMYSCPATSEYAQTMVSLPPCFFHALGPCQDHEPMCRFLSPTCSKPVSICVQPVPCTTPSPPQPCPMELAPCPPNQPVCPNVSASVQCLPPRHDSATICERRNVSFGCLDNSSPPECMLPPPCELFSRKCQADLPDEECNETCPHRAKEKKSSEKVICECSTSVSSLKKKHKKDKDKKRKHDLNTICECMGCCCEDELEQETCICACSDSGKVTCQCSKTNSSKSLAKKLSKKSSVGHQVTCECYDVALDPIKGNFFVEKAVGMSRESLPKKKSSHRGDGCHCRNSASKTSASLCSCRYPPAFEQLSCAGNIAGNCSCKDT